MSSASQDRLSNPQIVRDACPSAPCTRALRTQVSEACDGASAFHIRWSEHRDPWVHAGQQNPKTWVLASCTRLFSLHVSTEGFLVFPSAVGASLQSPKSREDLLERIKGSNVTHFLSSFGGQPPVRPAGSPGWDPDTVHAVTPATLSVPPRLSDTTVTVCPAPRRELVLRGASPFSL